jgi:hypothetical protein
MHKKPIFIKLSFIHHCVEMKSSCSFILKRQLFLIIVSRDFVLEVAACNSCLTFLKSNLTYTLMVVLVSASIISMYLIMLYTVPFLLHM